MRQLRVLLVDDSVAFRTQLGAVVNASGAARAVAFAGDGREAIAKAREYKPDVVTLDLHMPVMDGLAALPELKKLVPAPAVVMVSSVTSSGAKECLQAFELGAIDVIAKPDGNDAEANKNQLSAKMHGLLFDLAGAGDAQKLKSVRTTLREAKPTRAPQIVAIGCSTGGPAALAQIIPRLPARLPVPVVIVQHMPKLFTAQLAEALQSKSAIRVVEARHGETLGPGKVYIAPGGRHLRIVAGASGRQVDLTDDPPEHFCRPAVDYLFRSVAETYRDDALGVILTGMGRDGTLGLRSMKRFNVRVIGQSEGSCAVYGMPREARAAGLVDVELPAEKIAEAIVAAVFESG